MHSGKSTLIINQKRVNRLEVITRQTFLGECEGAFNCTKAIFNSSRSEGDEMLAMARLLEMILNKSSLTHKVGSHRTGVLKMVRKQRESS